MPMLARFESRIDVQHRNRFDFRIVEHALLDHRISTARPFFRRLKDQHDGAAEPFAFAREHAGCTQQHRRMRVVAARVHFPVDLRRKRQTGALGNRQRIHIGTQRNNAPRFSAAHDADDAGRR